MQLDSNVSLAENIILMADGNITQSFISILASNKKYLEKEYINQDPFADIDELEEQGKAAYDTLDSLVALA